MSNFQILSRLFKESIRPQILKLILSFVFMVVIALATGATAWLLDPAIENGWDPIIEDEQIVGANN